ncbi:MAG: prepilin peptidase [Hyphomonadaceae bacterium]|nr:prepilin peptidase [Hyphomonadaceae bacterium]
MILALFAASFFALCLFAALIDIETLTIPNWLNGWLAFLFVPTAIIAAPGWDAAGLHVLVGLIAFIVSVGLFFLGFYGGGDAKFIPAVMLWLGPAGAVPFLVATAMAGGVLTILIVILRALVPRGVTPGFGVATFEDRKGIPYGVAIAAGAFYAAPASPLLTDFLSQIARFS